MNKLILYCLILFCVQNAFSEAKDSTTINNLMVNNALRLVGTPYVASSLEVGDEEKLVFNMKGFDCMTFIENCIVLARTEKQQNDSIENFARQLQLIRYRGGIINGYTSRLHYTSDWVTDNEKKGILKDWTKEMGGKKCSINVSYMSTHPESYKQLKAHPELVDSMKQIEKTINKRQYYYIPKSQIKSKEHFISNGDIICFTTSIKGLDISHVGIAYCHDGILTFIHASSSSKKVIVNPESIADYCAKSKSNTGIMVLSLK